MPELVFTIRLRKARCEVSKKFENPLSDTRSHSLYPALFIALLFVMFGSQFTETNKAVE